MRSLNNNGYKLIMGFEGLSLTPYLCSAKVPTIGYGSTYYENGAKVAMKDKAITKARAFSLFQLVADDFALFVRKNVTSNINQNEFNSLVSFCYNVGKKNFLDSTLLKLVNKDSKNPAIKDEFMKWNKAGNKVIDGLTKRRDIESKNYFSL